MKCCDCELKNECMRYAGESECTHPLLKDESPIKWNDLSLQLIWHKCKAGYKFPSDAIVIPDDERTTDRDPRLVRCAVWDSKYILIDDLKKLPVDNG